MRLSRHIALMILAGWALSMPPSFVEAGSAVRAGQDTIRLHVVFNNLPYRAGLKTGWGFACLIDGLDKVVLFDTGGNGHILLSNMQRLGLDAQAVDAVVLSHIHADHTGGLDTFLARNPHVTVFIPESFPESFQREVLRFGAAIETVSGPRKLLDNMHSTGQMNHGIEEQALIVNTPQGLVMITGCAHPDVADMAEQAQAYMGRNIYLLMGGFHLIGRSDDEIRALIKRLKTQGVRKVAPSHCTGDTAIRLFRDAWKDDFIEGGLGAVIELPQ
jgi:7,8-dihydropterin-6-yl-methyl-4-(beta-D-ribofuranosyl)aminobenzene 5'-phosphate synthase